MFHTIRLNNVCIIEHIKLIAQPFLRLIFYLVIISTPFSVINMVCSA
jgi:hypothetical protein